jgi:hypothetical protein
MNDNMTGAALIIVLVFSFLDFLLCLLELFNVIGG